MSIVDFLARRLAMHLCLAGVEVAKDIIHMVFDDDVAIGDPEDDSINEDSE